jgi:hypothetical protein
MGLDRQILDLPGYSGKGVKADVQISLFSGRKVPKGDPRVFIQNREQARKISTSEAV